jgi:2-polyprenyl-3-methyl-5-hydroxy-6-metoxy-1,4-benzoquinol methylase
MDYQLQVHDELQKLARLGWTDWRQIPVDGSGEFKAASVVDEGSISYPSEAYESSPENPQAESFWAKHRAKEISKILSRSRTNLLWEVGAGNGSVAIPLRTMGYPVIGIEPLRFGAEALAKMGFTAYWGLLETLDLPSNSIEAIGVFDVLEHLAEPETLLREIHRVLEPNGTLITTVPANQWLFSDFDEAIGHFRRYSRKELQTLLNSAGFREHEVHFMFGFLVPVAFLWRTLPYKLGRRRRFDAIKSTNERQLAFSKIINPAITLVLETESRVGIFTGLSLISSSRK